MANSLLPFSSSYRQISIDRPDVKGREEIFKVHLGPIKVSENLDVHKLAEQGKSKSILNLDF